MAHYAIIDERNIVVKVITGVDENITQDDNGTPVGGSTEAWEAFYTAQLKNPNPYVKRTSYNHRIRKQYAGIGYTYDPDDDVFVAPQPYPSWTLDDNHDWQPPTPMPDDGKQYAWFEPNRQWIELI